jgi:catechol 2,3-dioxygenase-like lactoylglutathione lyase family enzyme
MAAAAALLLLLAGCAREEPAAPAAGAASEAPAIEIAVERPVLSGAGGPSGAEADGAAGMPGGAPAPEDFASLVPRLAVRDLAASAAFYRTLLGFETVSEPVGEPAGGPAATGGRALLARGGVRIALEETASEPGEAPSLATAGEEPAIALVLSVADAAALFDRLADRAPLVRGLRDTAWGTREFALADPDGHVVVLSQPL